VGKTQRSRQRLYHDKEYRDQEDAEGRIFRISFHLKSLKYSNTETYYLVIADGDGLPIHREEFSIDIAFAVDAFDFFS